MGDKTGAIRLRALAFIATALVLGCATVALTMWGTAPEAGAQQQTQGAPPTVAVSKPLKRDVQDSLEFSGQFAAAESVEIRSRDTGYLTEIHFTDGQIVKKGDLLFVIDPRPYEDAVAIAKAQVAQTEAGLDLAKRQLTRGADLVQKEYLAKSDYDTRVQQVAAAQAQLEGAHAQVRDAQINLEFARLTSPVSGRVGAHQVSIGNLISGGGANGQSTLLTTVVSLDPIWFTFDISESDYAALQSAFIGARQADGHVAGIPITLQLTGESGWAHKGVLDFVDNQIDKNSGTIHARATIANPDFAITPGQFGHLRLPSGPAHPALMVPDAAIVTDQTLRFVMVTGADGTVAQKRVALGPIVDGLREVKDGIAPDDQVIIGGLLRARVGGKVTPQPGAIQPAQTN